MNIRYHFLKYASLATGNGVYTAYREALAWDKLKPEQVKTKQDNLLSCLLAHAFHNVPYYKNILSKHGIYDGTGEPNLQSLNKLPFLTKDILREQYDSLLSEDWRKRKGKPNTSGGSTGEPVRFIQDNEHRRWCVYANKLYYNHKLGKYPGDRELLLWGSDRDVLKGSIGLTAKAVNLIYNREFLNAYRMNPEIMTKFVQKINVFKPVSIWTYVESFEMLARYAQNNSISIVPPKLIITTAGTLYPEVRALIERVFKAPVFDQYGSREVGALACQCLAKDHLHLFPWSHYVEIVDEDGIATKPGEEGDIVITSLVNYAMPLIRYKVGDRAVQPSKPCACGREAYTLEAVTGRITDHIVALDGSKIYAQFFIHLFFNRSWIKKFQVIQNEFDEVINRIEINTEPSQADINEIEIHEKKLLGNDMNIRFEMVDEILPSASGKHLYIINLTEEENNPRSPANSLR